MTLQQKFIDAVVLTTFAILYRMAVILLRRRSGGGAAVTVRQLATSK